MFPDVVKFKWQVIDTEGHVKDVLMGDGEVQKSTGTVASMMVIDEQKIHGNTYVCSVAHETSKNNLNATVTAPKGAIAPQMNRTSCTPQIPQITEDPFELRRTLYLAMFSYTIMIIKSMVYSALSVLICLRSSAAVNKSTSP
ncbi:hypothetical protein AAFF_G00001650 [Aldrovandia affinis]|uniref:Ig-like domain-containing protein n=1 Tax=Aldrovandia affinis TaxID=143900 RepID=A0AAD7TD09_9TELE|nr:hypothetical protein AAFF_G00001650 [Aldrovandia affinis]